jgi:hypothetical protein
MCTVQSCPNIAAFLFTAVIERGTVAASCDHHAEEEAKRLGHPWPIPELKPQGRVVRPRFYRAG